MTQYDRKDFRSRKIKAKYMFKHRYGIWPTEFQLEEFEKWLVGNMSVFTAKKKDKKQASLLE